MSSASRLRPLYRARQFFAALRPRISNEELDEARAYLDEGLWPLFESMALPDRRHCLDVFQALRRQGHADRDLLTAALLHDVGKGRNIHLWQRVAYVLLEALSPRLLERLAGGGLAALRRHAERGARLAAAAGANEAVMGLIRGDAADPRSDLLRAADDSC